MAKKQNSTQKDEKLLKNRATILIIDDEKYLRKSIKQILEKAGFICETAMDYDSAKKCVENSDFDLLLVDIILPKMSGLQMVKNLQDECNISSAIIFITGEPNLDTCIGAIRLGANDYREKPVEPKELVEAVKQSLIRRKKELKLIQEDKKRTVLVNESFNSNQIDPLNAELILKLEESLSNTHNALFQLKKKYSSDFSEEQRSLMNIIAQNNSQMKKAIKKYIIQ